MYDATGDKAYLDRAERGASAYIKSNIDKKPTKYTTRAFFWNKYAPPFVNLYRLYEITKDKKYLDAAQYGARRYVMFAWMCPEVPNENVLVNKGNMAPVYPYVSRYAPDPIRLPEERVPAWRVSEIGLTPEASGTMIGHRAIFMANLYPWLLRISHDAADPFLREVARWAVIGRYANFPGYHMNTARTTVYEKVDFPMRPHNKQSANSFHYNHSFPMMAMLIDFMVSDAETRSNYAIKFPSRLMDASAYMQSKFYTPQKGKFYGFDDAILWMPVNLLKLSSSNVNYITARGDNRFYIALTNQSQKDIRTKVYMNPRLLPVSSYKEYPAKMWINGGEAVDFKVNGTSFEVPVSSGGITAVAIEGIDIKPKFQDRLFNVDQSDAWKNYALKIEDIEATALFFNFGKGFKKVYVYLQDPYPDYQKAILHYMKDGKELKMEAAEYPFEFTVDIDEGQDKFEFWLETVDAKNKKKVSEKYELGK